MRLDDETFEDRNKTLNELLEVVESKKFADLVVLGLDREGNLSILATPFFDPEIRSVFNVLEVLNVAATTVMENARTRNEMAH
jgi:hypothetical protein